MVLTFFFSPTCKSFIFNYAAPTTFEKFPAAAMIARALASLCEMDVLLLDVFTLSAPPSLKRFQLHIVQAAELKQESPPLYGQVLTMLLLPSLQFIKQKAVEC